MTWIGDGGSSTGAFHEGLNLAAAQRASLVLILENNQWAYSTPVSKQVPLRDLAERGRAYGITSVSVDGNDVVAVYRTAKSAVEQCRAGNGPVLIEAKTHRMRGHAQHDPAEYVPKEMREYWEARDPIALFEKFLTANKIWNAADKKEIEARIEKVLSEDREFAENSPMPPPELAEQGVYCDGCHTIEADWQRPEIRSHAAEHDVQHDAASEGFRRHRSGLQCADRNGGRRSRTTCKEDHRKIRSNQRQRRSAPASSKSPARNRNPQKRPARKGRR